MCSYERCCLFLFTPADAIGPKSSRCCQVRVVAFGGARMRVCYGRLQKNQYLRLHLSPSVLRIETRSQSHTNWEVSEVLM